MTTIAPLQVCGVFVLYLVNLMAIPEAVSRTSLGYTVVIPSKCIHLLAVSPLLLLEPKYDALHQWSCSWL